MLQVASSGNCFRGTNVVFGLSINRVSASRFFASGVQFLMQTSPVTSLIFLKKACTSNNKRLRELLSFKDGWDIVFSYGDHKIIWERKYLASFII